MTNSEQKLMRKTLEQIAAEHLGIETLETRNSDHLYFHEVGVWGLKAALEAACDAALFNAKAYRATATDRLNGRVVRTWTLAANDLDGARERAHQQAASRWTYCSDIAIRVEPIEDDPHEQENHSESDANLVPPNFACPKCGQRDMDQLICDEDGEHVACQTCGTSYAVMPLD